MLIVIINGIKRNRKQSNYHVQLSEISNNNSTAILHSTYTCMHVKFVATYTSTVVVTQFIYANCNQYCWSYYLNCLCKHDDHNNADACTLLNYVGTSMDSTTCSLLKTCGLMFINFSKFVHLCLFTIDCYCNTIMIYSDVKDNAAQCHVPWVCNFRWKHIA